MTRYFYLPSLSARTLLYKGMLTGTQLLPFYPDLERPEFESALALVHQRYSTNTLPSWPLSQPFRLLAHNGEINTLRGNVNRMRAREAILASPLFGDDLAKLLPIIQEWGSDSAMLDNALELLVLGGRSLPHAMMMLIPEAWGPRYQMSEDRRAFYEYHAAIMEPWDGPAAVAFTDGRVIGGILDRNGLRPARWTETRDGLVVLASESGVIPFEPERILRRGRLQPGRMFLVDLEERRVVPDREIKARDRPPEAVPQLGARQPHRAARPLRGLRDPRRGDRAAARAPARARLHRGGVPHGARADGRARAGGGRLDGQRRGARRALDAAGAALRLLQAALRAGHQPPDRPAARGAGDVAHDLHRAPAQPPRRDAGARAPAQAAPAVPDARTTWSACAAPPTRTCAPPTST